MKFLGGLWKSLKTNVRMWYWRRSVQGEIRRINQLVNSKTANDPIRNKELVKPLSYQDGHFEHYEKMSENLPKPFVPPPDIDDGLN